MKQLQLPPNRGQLDDLEAGDDVLLSGPAFTARDTTLIRLGQIVTKGEVPPVDLDGQTIFFAGPSPPRLGESHGSIGPTTSARMVSFFTLLSDLGVVTVIGKGPLGSCGIASARRCGLVYLAAVGGAGAFFSQRVVGIEVVGLEELGPEAIHKVEMRGFPAVVALDREGRDFLEDEMKRYGRRGQRDLT